MADSDGRAGLVCLVKRGGLLVMLAGLLSGFTGCATPSSCCPHTAIRDQLDCRVGQDVQCVPPCQFVLPSDANLDDGVTEDEAVAISLSNNSAFQSTVAQLGMSHGDRVQAGLLTNPNMSMFIPVGVKQWEWTLYLPLEAFVLRPHRLEIAESDYQRIANQLVQNGLTLVRDVRVAHADLILAERQLALGRESQELRRGISDVTQKQFDSGDISELETMTAEVDSLNAGAALALLEQDVEVARARLGLLMGIPAESPPIFAVECVVYPDLLPEPGSLVDEGLRCRPDVQAANWAVKAACQREELSRWLFLRFDAGMDANGKGSRGFELGPAFRFDIPLFNRNEGGRIRAGAEVVQAMHARDAVHDQIVQEIRTAAAQYAQASNSLAILRNEIIPALEKSREIAEKGYTDGGTDYLLVLQTTGQYIDAKSRLLTQEAALQRSWAELERSVGHSLRDRFASHVLAGQADAMIEPDDVPVNDNAE
ncbi:MAG: TolC family protein [Planctomycetales bacterium]|nr:TolC family protein [Planctomycetales bacterium]